MIRLATIAGWLAASLAAQDNAAERCRSWLAALQEKRELPGVSAAVILPGGEELTFAVGMASKEADVAMTTDHRLLSGSIGKTYVAAAALHLAAEDKLDLDARAASFFESDRWFERLPNAADVTVRQLLRHQSGIPRYVFGEEFWNAVIEKPDRVWQPEELLAYVFDAEPLFPAGEGWAYADTNFIVVGMILERVAKVKFYDYARKHLLEPHGLDDTVPSDRREIPGLAQGYISTFRELGLPARSLEDGVFVINPQFEWCGGGFANTPLDLARWARVLYTGEAFDGDYLDTLLDGVKSGRRGEYGLGVMIRETPAGRSIGHDGIMTGYLSTMAYFPDAKIAVAIQVNTDNSRSIGMPLALAAAELCKLCQSQR